METNTAFVRTYGIVELYPITEVHLHFAFIIDPRHFKGKNTVGLDHTFYELRFFKLGVSVINIFDRKQYFIYGL